MLQASSALAGSEEENREKAYSAAVSYDLAIQAANERQKQYGLLSSPSSCLACLSGPCFSFGICWVFARCRYYIFDMPRLLEELQKVSSPPIIRHWFSNDTIDDDCIDRC